MKRIKVTNLFIDNISGNSFNFVTYDGISPLSYSNIGFELLDREGKLIEKLAVENRSMEAKIALAWDPDNINDNPRILAELITSIIKGNGVSPMIIAEGLPSLVCFNLSTAKKNQSYLAVPLLSANKEFDAIKKQALSRLSRSDRFFLETFENKNIADYEQAKKNIRAQIAQFLMACGVSNDDLATNEEDSRLEHANLASASRSL